MCGGWALWPRERRTLRGVWVVLRARGHVSQSWWENLSVPSTGTSPAAASLDLIFVLFGTLQDDGALVQMFRERRTLRAASVVLRARGHVSQS